MQYQYLEMLLKEPTTPLIMWLGFGLIGLWGAVSILVFTSRLKKPKLWVLGVMYSSGEKYLESKRLKITYIFYSLISLAFSTKINEILLFSSEIILAINILMPLIILISKMSVPKKSNQFDSEPE